MVVQRKKNDKVVRKSSSSKIKVWGKKIESQKQRELKTVVYVRKEVCRRLLEFQMAGTGNNETLIKPKNL